MGAGQSVDLQPSRVIGVVFVTADWCGACTREKPNWEIFVNQEMESGDCAVQYKQVPLGTPEFQTYRTRVEAFPSYFLTHADGSETVVVGGRGSVERYRQMIYGD